MRQVIGEKNLFDILRPALSHEVSHEHRAISFQLSAVSFFGNRRTEIGGRKSEIGNRKSGNLEMVE